MASLRKASAYTRRTARPYTRKSKKRSLNYIRTVPPTKIVKMQSGDLKGYLEGKYPIVFKFVGQENIQLRDNAIESARQVIVKTLDKTLSGQYCFIIKVHPHHILRENKMLTGAGADRMSSGMKLSFGKAVGRAAFVTPGKEIFVIAVNTEKGRKLARSALTKIKPKIPGSNKIVVEEVKGSVSFPTLAKKEKESATIPAATN